MNELSNNFPLLLGLGLLIIIAIAIISAFARQERHHHMGGHHGGIMGPHQGVGMGYGAPYGYGGYGGYYHHPYRSGGLNLITLIPFGLLLFFIFIFKGNQFQSADVLPMTNFQAPSSYPNEVDSLLEEIEKLEASQRKEVDLDVTSVTITNTDPNFDHRTKITPVLDTYETQNGDLIKKPMGLAVQIESFDTWENANNKYEVIRNLIPDYQLLLGAQVVDGVTRYKVLLGSFLNREEANHQLPDIKKKYNPKSYIVNLSDFELYKFTE